LIDEIVPEPLGGGHRDMDAVARNLKSTLVKTLDDIRSKPIDRLMEARYERLMSFGVVSG